MKYRVEKREYTTTYYYLLLSPQPPHLCISSPLLFSSLVTVTNVIFFVSNRHSHQPLLQGVPAQGKLATFIYGIHLTHCLSAISTSAIHADFSFFPRAHLPLLILDSEHPKRSFQSRLLALQECRWWLWQETLEPFQISFQSLDFSKLENRGGVLDKQFFALCLSDQRLRCLNFIETPAIFRSFGSVPYIDVSFCFLSTRTQLSRKKYDPETTFYFRGDSSVYRPSRPSFFSPFSSRVFPKTSFFLLLTLNCKIEHVFLFFCPLHRGKTRDDVLFVPHIHALCSIRIVLSFRSDRVPLPKRFCVALSSPCHTLPTVIFPSHILTEFAVQGNS